jgi:succinate dehydrogenase flavin-adding protein (antitoxin of CptAB toxin-antitoxin module)
VPSSSCWRIGATEAVDEGVNPAPQYRSRLSWRCRRGRREWDVLLLSWLERHFDTASVRQRAAFEALLDLPDGDLEHFLATAEHPLRAELQLPAGAAPAAEPSGRPSL